MQNGNTSAPWDDLSPAEKKRRLWEEQKTLLDTFLAHGAITRAQYDKSLGDLTLKMGFAEEKDKR